MKATIFLTCLATAMASPIQWTPELSQWFGLIAAKVGEARTGLLQTPTCDLSDAQQPAAATPLPPPTGLTLVQVAVGRGVQNYTCAKSDASTVPVATGAIANLYDASCLAASYPDMLQMAPNLALQYPLPTDANAPLQPTNLIRSGNHYFNGGGVPTFNMNDNNYHLGVLNAKVAIKVAAPATAIKGQGGVGDGSVAWLRLDSVNTTVGDLKTVYRLNTAGGQPPATCDGQASQISVQYAAEYWFYT